MISMQMLVGVSRSNHLGSVKYIIDNASNLDINVRESDQVKHNFIAFIIGRYMVCFHLFAACLDSTDVGYQQG